MHTLVALPPGEGGRASELAFPVGDWERGNTRQSLKGLSREAFTLS